MKLFIEYDPPNWNDYINLERKNKYAANRIKQKEKKIIELAAANKTYTGEYPIEIVFKPHFESFRKDLDNTRVKGLLDGLVAAKVLKNDNLKHIQRIVIEPIFDKNRGIEIEINELKR